MKRQVGIAVAGAVLAAGLTGGAGFAARSGSNGSNGTSSTHTNTSTSSNDPAVAAHLIHCLNLQLERSQLLAQVATARNAAQARRLVRQANQLQQQWLRECT